MLEWLSTRACALLAAALLVAACGSADAETSDVGAVGDPELSGIVRDPAPQVDEATLPSLSDGGGDVTFRAQPGNVQVVYWGFTNCPDVCPTTLADFSVALRRLDPDLSARVELVMVGVDPDRDLEVLDRYVNAFVPGSVAAGSSDVAELEAAAAPFGASWEVRTLDDGTVEVDHSPFLYAVDDAGQLALTWQFGASSVDMASDLEVLLERADDAA
ncbi:MAG: SCO family protein [Actinomycetota bacterium]